MEVALVERMVLLIGDPTRALALVLGSLLVGTALGGFSTRRVATSALGPAFRKRALGALSIFVMTIPYCMIHFGKPMPEAFGAIGAGVVLGFMSLKTRSVWMGAGLHICVAWTMDTLALIQRFGIFT